MPNTNQYIKILYYMHHVYLLYVQGHNLDINTAGGVVSPKGRGESRARWTFQSIINISFPKIVGGGGGGAENFSDIPFSLTYRNLYNTPRSDAPGFGI
jgi:hypothetical protein